MVMIKIIIAWFKDDSVANDEGDNDVNSNGHSNRADNGANLKTAEKKKKREDGEMVENELVD